MYHIALAEDDPAAARQLRQYASAVNSTDCVIECSNRHTCTCC